MKNFPEGNGLMFLVSVDILLLHLMEHGFIEHSECYKQIFTDNKSQVSSKRGVF